MINKNIYKKAKKNFDRKFDFDLKFNTDNNLKFGDEGYLNYINMVSELELEADLLAMAVLNLVWCTTENEVKGIDTKQLSENGRWHILCNKNRKERAEFMISILRKELKNSLDCYDTEAHTCN